MKHKKEDAPEVAVEEILDAMAPDATAESPLAAKAKAEQHIADVLAMRQAEKSKQKAEQHIQNAATQQQSAGQSAGQSASGILGGIEKDSATGIASGDAMRSSWGFQLDRPQKPSTGRVIHYHESYFPDRALVGFIIAVNSDTNVDLAVIDPSQPQSPVVIKTAVEQAQGDEKVGKWMFPPKV